MSVRRISAHAKERWGQRMRKTHPFGLRNELKKAQQIKRNHCHSMGITWQRGYRYYVSPHCVFVVRACNKTLITLWRR